MSFADNANYVSVRQVKNFMFADVEKSLKLNDNQNIGAPGFLIALGLCCYTEYWGKLVKGISEGCGRTTFNAFLDRLDPTYYPKLRDRANIYRDIRCGRAHSYLIAKNANIDAVTDIAEHGIVFDAKKNWYSFYIKTYFEEFKYAVNQYMRGLVEGTENRYLFEDALKGKAELI